MENNESNQINENINEDNLLKNNNSKKAIILIIVLIVLAAASFGVSLLFMGSSEEKETEDKDVVEVLTDENIIDQTIDNMNNLSSYELELANDYEFYSSNSILVANLNYKFDANNKISHLIGNSSANGVSVDYNAYAESVDDNITVYNYTEATGWLSATGNSIDMVNFRISDVEAIMTNENLEIIRTDNNLTIKGDLDYTYATAFMGDSIDKDNLYYVELNIVDNYIDSYSITYDVPEIGKLLVEVNYISYNTDLNLSVPEEAK